ncbi:MAG: trehalose operon repressor [Carnobacterium alterfunditum]
MSKFNKIFLDLEAAILNQSFISGDLLPSENELVKTYNVSRETIRKALNLLLEKGYIQKLQGKGSVVLDIKRFDFPVSGLTSYKELQDAQQMNSQTIVVHNGLQPISEDLANHLKLPLDTPVLYLERLRKVNGEVVIIDKDYLLASIVPTIPTDAAEDSLYHYIEHTLGLTISYAQKEITVDPITEEDKRLMDLEDDTHVVVVRSDVYLEDTTLFQHTESRHRLDRFRFVDFARRRNSL